MLVCQRFESVGIGREAGFCFPDGRQAELYEKHVAELLCGEYGKLASREVVNPGFKLAYACRHVSAQT